MALLLCRWLQSQAVARKAAKAVAPWQPATVLPEKLPWSPAACCIYPQRSALTLGIEIARNDPGDELSA